MSNHGSLEGKDSTEPTVIVHCSDIHFGHGFLPDRAERLIEEINSLCPDAVVVSGDLTMRAREPQFAQAREFLKALKSKILVIPGNHDVPLYDVLRRVVNPFKLYRRFIDDLNEGPLSLKNVSLYGFNTVNPLRHQQGKFRPNEITGMKKWFDSQPNQSWKIAVVHQHFANVPGHERPGVYPASERFLSRLVQGGAQAVLHGHVHYNHIASAVEFFPKFSDKVALICAGTPTSHRVRGISNCNNFNVLKFYPDSYEVHQIHWDADKKRFEGCNVVTFNRDFYS